VAISDDSFVSCSFDKTAKRWCIQNDGDNNQRTLRLAGTLVHNKAVLYAVVKDENTLITTELGSLFVEWNVSTCERRNSLDTDGRVVFFVMTKSKSNIVCGYKDGLVQIRRLSDFTIISSFAMYTGSVWCISELWMVHS